MTESYAIFHGTIKTFNNIAAVVHLYFNNVGLFEFNHLVLHFMKADYDVVEEVLTETYGLAQATKYQESIRDIDSGMVLTHVVIDRFGPEHLLSMTLKKN